MPDPWAYAFAIENFAQGKWLLSDEEMATGRLQADLAGGRLLQYVEVEPGQWALRKSPGYPLLAIPFTWLGRPRLANVALAIVAAIPLYAWLAAWRDEFTACLGVLLFFFAPMTLLALHVSTMDTFASGALLLAAGSILLFDLARPAGPQAIPAAKKRGQRTQKQRSPAVPISRLGLLLLAGFMAGWAVVVRLQNAPILACLGLFLVWQHKQKGAQWLKLASFIVGAGLALLVLLHYNQAIFGRPLDTGYQYDSPYQSLFLWEDNPATQVDEQPTWLADPSPVSLASALLQHLVGWAQPAWLGWPFLPLALLALPLVLWQRRHQGQVWLMVIWLAVTYAPYAGLVYFGITRELAVPFYRSWGFFAVDRYLFPASLPLAFFTLTFLNRLPRWLAAVILLVYAIGGSWLHWQVLNR
jgi:hypothetical protein